MGSYVTRLSISTKPQISVLVLSFRFDVLVDLLLEH